MEKKRADHRNNTQHPSKEAHAQTMKKQPNKTKQTTGHRKQTRRPYEKKTSTNKTAQAKTSAPQEKHSSPWCSTDTIPLIKLSF